MDIDRVGDPGTPVVRGELCRHLRCKGMYVGGEHVQDPNTMAYDATIWWCARTEKQLGPDDYPCHATECRAGRRCYAPENPT